MAAGGSGFRRTFLVLLADVVVLAGFWWLIPEFKRPFEALMVVVFVLSVLTAIVARPRALKTFALLAASVSATVFALEMGQKFVNVVRLFDGRPAPARGDLPPLSFSTSDSSTYFAARARALADGADPEAFREDFAGDIFAGVPKSELRIRHSDRGDRIQTIVSLGDTPYLRDPPLGIEMRPGIRYREYATVAKSPDLFLWDAEVNINRFGTRFTRGAEDADDVRLFMGCSFVFGSYLSDHQTLPYYYSELHGFAKRVVNTAIGGNGPHHSLRDLELYHRLGKSGIEPSQVKAVYFTLLRTHIDRVTSVFPPGSPRYELEDGKAVYKGTFADTGDLGRLGIMMERSRIYPILRDRFSGEAGESEVQLTYAIVARMAELCRERFGVGLTIINWWTESDSTERLREMGITVVPVTDVFGDDWSDRSVFFLLPDGHPSANANRLLAEHIYALEMQENHP